MAETLMESAAIAQKHTLFSWRSAVVLERKHCEFVYRREAGEVGSVVSRGPQDKPSLLSETISIIVSDLIIQAQYTAQESRDIRWREYSVRVGHTFQIGRERSF
jgi:hypothetical protein